MLTAEKFDVIEAEIGMRLVQANSPDLVICDVMMPALDGSKVLTALRNNPRNAIIPFVFVTAKVGKVDLRQGMQLGADDYLTKPFTRDELLGSVTVRLKKQETMLRQYTAECQQSKELGKRVQDFRHFNESREGIFKKFSEDLRQSISKLNIAIHIIKNAQSRVQRERYLKI